MEHRYAKVNDISFDKIHKLAIIVLTETFSKRMIGEVMRSCSSTRFMVSSFAAKSQADQLFFDVRNISIDSIFIASNQSSETIDESHEKMSQGVLSLLI